MKLPTASLKNLKLRSVQPFKQLLNKLSKGKPSSPDRSQKNVPNTGARPAAPQPNFKSSKGSQVAFHLLLVKPWVLVAGLWLVSMLGAAIALEGMISPRRLTMALPEPQAEVASTAKDSFINIEQGSDDIVSDGIATENTETASSTSESAEAAANGSDFPTWPVGALVGTCAAGCLVISRQRARVRLAAMRSRSVSRGESRGKVRRVRIDADTPIRSGKPAQKTGARKPVSAIARPSQSRTHQAETVRAAVKQPIKQTAALKSAASSAHGSKKRRPRPQGASAAPKSAAVGRVLVSRSTAQQAAPTSRVSRPQPVKRLAARAGSRQSIVSVVPASEDHPLDWTGSSLAHKMDVRPQKVSSL